MLLDLRKGMGLIVEGSREFVGLEVDCEFVDFGLDFLIISAHFPEYFSVLLFVDEVDDALLSYPDFFKYFRGFLRVLLESAVQH